jgi:putative MATE family efflux protein
MKDKALYKHLFSLALPIALQNMISYSVGLADNVMVGSLGEMSISGVYVCNQIQIILQMLVAGIGTAQLVIAAQYWGKGDKTSVKGVIGIAVKLAAVCAVIFWAAVFFFPGEVIGLYTNDAQVINEAVKYVRIICFTYLFFALSNVLLASMRCIGTVKIGLYVSIAAFFTNVALNWVLIFGHLGAPALGIRGAAIATLVTRILEFLIVGSYVFIVDKKLVLKLKDLIHTNTLLLKDFFRYGFPVILGDIFWGLNLTVQGAIVGRLGASSIAAVSIANTLFAVISVGVYGTANASAIVVGNAVGEGNLEHIRYMSGKLQKVFLLVGIGTGVFLFAIRDFILSFYSISDETLSVARALMMVLSVTAIGTAYQMSTLTGIVRAGGAVHFVLINDIIFVWGIVIPLSLVMAFVVEAPTWIVFLCLKCDQILKCAVAVVKVNRYDWIKKLTKDFTAAVSD